MFEELRNIITPVDWNQFHFLRPAYLYLFVPLSAIVVLLLAGNRERKKWKRIVQPALRPFMFTKSSQTAILFPLIAFIIAMSFIILSLAGPTWKKKNFLEEKIQVVTLIALDLSGSMLARDIQPSRLQRAKFKVSDFLDANPRSKIGLIAFAGTAHPVLPFTGDYKIIEQHAENLENRIMPVPGSNIHALLDVVDTMMKTVVAPGTVLLITDVLDADDAALLTHWLSGTIHHLEILLMSTPNGALVPGYKNILSRQDPVVLQNLTQNPKIILTRLTLDKSDVTGIAYRISNKLLFEKESKKTDQDWEDMGWLLLIPALLLTACWFRKGWVIQWCLLPLTIAPFTSCGIKSRHPDWWYTKDYQGQLFQNVRRYSDAANRFANENRKAVAYFKAGDFEAAASLFALDTSASGNYNCGLALAGMGRYSDAEDAFRKASGLDPALKEMVDRSMAEADRAKQRADSIIRFGQTAVSKETRDLRAIEKKGKKDPLNERKPKGGDEKLSSDTRVKELPKSGDRITDVEATNIQTAKEVGSPELNTKPDKRDQFANNILLRRAKADPTEFLHKRFLLQRKRYFSRVSRSKNPW